MSGGDGSSGRPWSLWNRRAEHELLPLARQLGAGIVAWGPLGNGFLAGDVALADDDFRRHAPRFQGDNLARNRDYFAPLRRIAEEAGVTPAQLALAWLLARDEHAVPIPGSRTPAHIDENLAAAEVRLHEATLARVDEASASVEAAGGTLLQDACASRPRRYPEPVVGRGESAWWRRR